MQLIAKVMLANISVLVTLFALASIASADTVTPAGTAVSGFASDTVLTYAGNSLGCDGSTLTGTTANPASDSLSLALDFYDTCAGFGNSFIVVCDPNVVTWHVIATGNGTGTVNMTLDSDFHCSLTMKVLGFSICSITISGEQELSATDSVYDAGDTTLALVVGGISATKDAGGSSLCGPSSGIMEITATYDFTPGTFSIT